MDRDLLKRNGLYALILIGLLLFSLGGLVLIKKFVGYVGVEVSSQAGTITSLKIDDRRQTVYWAGAFGLVFSEEGFTDEQYQTFDPGDLTSVTLVFDCFSLNEPEQEIYASTNDSINFNSLRAGSTSMIDNEFLGLEEYKSEMANNTFNRNTSVLVGTTNITSVPAVYSYTNSAPGVTFSTGILNDSGRVVIVGKAYLSSLPSFKGTNVRYQMLLPIPNASTRWYFFRDPNDECPEGLSVGQQGVSTIQGYVFESNSTTPIFNATVTAGANSSTTNALGFYSFVVPGGRLYDLISYKQGYITNISTVNTTIGVNTTKNLTMPRFFGFGVPNATIVGYVIDNFTNFVIPNVTITIKGAIAYTNDSGNYTMNVSAGSHTITASMPGYVNFIGNFSIENFQNLTYVINMTPLANGVPVNGTPFVNGTIEGYIRHNSTSALLPNVTVTVAGVESITNSQGYYNLTIPWGNQNLVAIKIGFNVFTTLINISNANGTGIVYNFSMQPEAVFASEDGSLYVQVRDSSGVMQGATVSILGLSNTTNSTGGVSFPSVDAGTHVVASTKSGYANFVGQVNISSNAVTYYNITMETIPESGLGTGSGAGSGAGLGAGSGAGLGAGRGPGTGLTTQIEQPIEVREYEISLNRILKKVREGTFITVPLVIRNNLEEEKDVRLTIEGDIRGMIQLDKERMIISGTSSEEIEITLFGNRDPGVYEGFLVFSGDIEEKIPIYILVLEKERLSVETLLIKVTPDKERYTAGSDLKFRVDMQNLLSDEQYKVQLSYTLESVKNNVSMFLEKEEVAILTSFSLLKNYEIPSELPPGNYRIKVRAEFLEYESEHFGIFSISEPLYQYAVFGFIPLWLLLSILMVSSTGTFGVMLYKKKQAAKKRYQIKIDYSQLPPNGPRNGFVGMIAETTNRTYFKLDQMQLHTLIAGSTGSGKSVGAQVVVEEALNKGVSIIVFDPTAQWTGFLRKSLDKKMLLLYQKFGMKKTDAKAFNGNIKSIIDARELIDIKKYMKPGEISVFTINKLDPADADILVANTIRQVFKANLPESPELRLLIVFDEVHRLLPKFGGSGQGFLQIERALREFRKWGVGLVLISQVLKDFIGETKANINTTIQMRTSDETDLGRINEDFGEKLLQSIVKAPPGTGMIQNSEYNKGEPYFVAFRALMHSTQRLTDKELDDYYKYNEIIDDVEFEMEQLEKEGVDLFDFQLELKMALDKVKAGSFHMVDIYLESLRPRIKAQWEKMGKQPRKREKKLVSNDELKEELERAKRDKEKAQAAQSAAAPGVQVAVSTPAAPLPAPNQAPPAQQSKPADDSSALADAVKKAMDAKAQAAQTPPQQPQAPQISEEVKNLIELSHIAITGNDREGLRQLYAQLQGHYKGASKEEKVLIYREVQDIHKRIAA